MIFLGSYNCKKVRFSNMCNNILRQNLMNSFSVVFSLRTNIVFQTNCRNPSQVDEMGFSGSKQSRRGWVYLKLNKGDRATYVTGYRSQMCDKTNELLGQTLRCSQKGREYMLSTLPYKRAAASCSYIPTEYPTPQSLS